MNYTQEQINDVLFARNKIRKVRYKYNLLDNDDAFIQEISVESCKITNNIFREISRLATFQFNEYKQPEIDFLKNRIQVMFVLDMPDGGFVEWSLGIFLLASPTQNINGTTKTRDISAYDKTLILVDDKLTERFYIEKGRLYTDVIIQLFQETLIATFRIVPSEAVFNADREFEIGTSIKEVINTLLTEINYNSIWVDANGWFVCEPYIEPSQKPYVHKYTSKNNIVLPELTNTLDLVDRANVFVAYSVNRDTNEIMRAKAINNEMTSSLSVINRGREIVKVVELDNIPNMEVLQAKADRMLIEESTAYNHIVFNTKNMPTHGHGENIYLDVENLSDISFVLNETGWSLDTSGEMSHEVRRLVRL